MKLIFSKHGGEIVALKILLMRLSGKFGYKGLPKNQEDKVDVSSALESFCQKILRNFDYSRVNKLSDNIDYEIGSLIEYCFVKESAYSSALQICKKLSTGFSKNEIEISYFSHVLNSLATTQPLAFLDGFFGPNREKDHQFTRGFPGEIRVVTNPMSAIADDVIINWCEKNPKIRYHKIASEIMPFFYNELENRMAWTSLAMCLLNNSPNPIMILEEYKTTFIPMSWSNSRSSIMQKCMVLFPKSVATIRVAMKRFLEA